MKALERYRRRALFDFIISVIMILALIFNRDVFTLLAAVYFAYMAIDSLGDYLSLSRGGKRGNSP